MWDGREVDALLSLDAGLCLVSGSRALLSVPLSLSADRLATLPGSPS